MKVDVRRRSGSVDPKRLALSVLAGFTLLPGVTRGFAAGPWGHEAVQALGEHGFLVTSNIVFQTYYFQNKP